MSAPWKGPLTLNDWSLPGAPTLVAHDADGGEVARLYRGYRSDEVWYAIMEALVHRANAYDVVREIADGYKDAPCFSELLGEADGERHCGCPVCGLRAIREALASTQEEG